MDMHSGGGAKEKYGYIYIEAPEKEAIEIFVNRFGHHPLYTTCDCCGEDYSITESDTLEQATGYERGCHYDETMGGYVEELSRRAWPKKYRTLEEYKKDPDILIITADQI